MPSKAQQDLIGMSGCSRFHIHSSTSKSSTSKSNTTGDEEAYFVKVFSVSGHRFTYELHGGRQGFEPR